MTRTKAAQPKKQKVSKGSEAVIDEDDLLVPSLDSKIKKPIEIDVIEAVLNIDEKIEPEVIVADEGAEEAATEELAIDDEEIDPFGDKWEQ